MQAVCDTNLQFLFASVKCPRKTNGINAYRHSILSALVEELPDDYFVSGNNAYVNLNHLLLPFPGHDFGSQEDSFNFFLSLLLGPLTDFSPSVSYYFYCWYSYSQLEY